jgi:hypothetical protein
MALLLRGGGAGACRWRDWYLATLRTHFWGMVPENLFKWEHYEPLEGEWRG